MAILPGRRLGPYEILSAIGAGGMGELYKTRDTPLDRILAWSDELKQKVSTEKKP